MPSYLQIENISKSYGPKVLFEHIGFNINEGDKIALIAPNGTGKTSLLRILAGKDSSDSGGKILFLRDIRIAFLEQEYEYDPEATVWDQIIKDSEPWTRGLDPEHLAEYEQRIRRLLTSFGMSEYDRKMKVLSGGEIKRAAIIVMLASEADFFVMDEPTNHLDIETMDWLENYLKTYRGAVLVVSHDRYFLDAVCTRIWELRGKTINTYRGNYSAYLPQREAADERQQKMHDAAVEKAAKLQDYIDRNLVRASTTKMAQSRRKQLEKLEIVEAPTAEAWELNFRFEYDIEPYDELVIMKNLTVRIGERTLIDTLEYTVHRGDKLVIAGPNGTGKSTLLQVLDGKRRPSGGMVRLGSGAKPGIFTQQQARRAGRVIDAIWNQYPRFTELEVRSHLARFGYRGEDVFKDCAQLSGGELARLRFAELALERPNLMFLDEPTNHLDIYMRESLTQALAAYTGTLLLVTHDRYLMQTLGCPILYLEDGKATFYSNFEALKNRETAKPAQNTAGEETVKKQAYGKEQRRRRAEVRARLKAVETEIETLGAHIVELENEINDPEVLRDHLLLRDKCDELEDTRFHQQELFDEWEKLAQEQEEFEAEGE